MNWRIPGSVFAGFLILFFGGWLIYGILLGEFWAAHTTEYEGLMKSPPDLGMLALSHIFFSIIVVLVVEWTSSYSFVKGAMNGALIVGLIGAGMDFSHFAFFNLQTPVAYVADVAIFTFLGAFMGGF